MAKKQTTPGPDGLVKALLEEDDVEARLDHLLSRYFNPEDVELVTGHPLFPSLVFHLAARENIPAAQTARVIRSNLEVLDRLG